MTHTSLSRQAGRGVHRLCLALLLAASSVAADDAEEAVFWGFDARLDTYSAYIWRGKALDKHGVTQPSAIGSLSVPDIGLFALKVWSNWDLSQRSGDSKATRTGGGINVLNLTPSYTRFFGPLDFTLGNIFYTFPGDGYPKTMKSTYELYTTLAYNNPIVTPSLSVYYDYRGVGGGFLEDNPLKDLYARAALDKSVQVANRVAAGGCVLLGAGTSHYNAVRYNSPGEGFADYQVSLFLRYALSETLSLGGTLAYTGLVGGTWGLDRGNISPDEMFWGGVNLRLLF